MRRQLGRELRRARENAGKTHADVKNAKIAAESKMNRIENGRIGVKPGDVWALAHLYGLDSTETTRLAALAEGTMQDGWWEEYGPAVPEWLSVYVGFEDAASRIATFHPELVHGLLQTRDYARAVISADTELAPDVVEQRVKFRLERQARVLDRARPVRLEVFLGAGAVTLVVGSPQVLAEQVEHLRAADKRRDVEVRILPWLAGAHSAMRGAFAVLDFRDEADPPLAYVESLIGSRTVEKAEYVTAYRQVLAELRTKSVPIEEWSE